MGRTGNLQECTQLAKIQLQNQGFQAEMGLQAGKRGWHLGTGTSSAESRKVLLSRSFFSVPSWKKKADQGVPQPCGIMTAIYHQYI